MFLTPKRSQHFAAMVLICDGVMALIHPSNDAQAMHYLSENPTLTRAIGATQILAGVLWALHQSREN